MSGIPLGIEPGHRRRVMRRLLNLALLVALVVVVATSPALAKKAPIQRTVVDGVTLAEVKPNTQISPFYPATARTSNPHAVVVVAAEVNEEGRVGKVELISSSIEGMGFEVSAKGAVKQWRFLPALENDLPVDSVTVIRLTFAPPTLARSEGFVFTERSPRLYVMEMFTAAGTVEGRAMAKSFATTSSAERDAFSANDLPPCQATRNGNECMYNKQDLRQYGGLTDGVIGTQPHNTLPPNLGSNPRGVR